MRELLYIILTALGVGMLIWGLIIWIDGEDRGKILALRGALLAILGEIIKWGVTGIWS